MIFKGGGSGPTVPPSGSTHVSIPSFQTKSRVEQNQDQTSNYDKMEDPEFRYLYDMLSSDTKCAQCKFRQLLPLFTNSEPSANVDPKWVNSIYVRSVMQHTSVTWPMTTDCLEVSAG